MTRSLSLLTEKLINPHNDPRIYWAKEVTFDYSSSHAIRVDYMKFKPVNNTVGGIEKGDFYCYEVKSSVEDFHSKNGHNFIGDFNYYIMPEEVYAAVSLEIPYAVGVYCPDGAEAADPNENTSAIEKLLSALSDGECKGIKGATAYKITQFATEKGLI